MLPPEMRAFWCALRGYEADVFASEAMHASVERWKERLAETRPAPRDGDVAKAEAARVARWRGKQMVGALADVVAPITDAMLHDMVARLRARLEQ